MRGWEGIDEFVAVAECGNFSLAAERLRVSASYVSRQVAQLEARLEARLFYRTTRRVSLTEAGQTLLNRCQRLVEERDEAFQSLGNLQSAPSGLLRMTAAVAYGERFIVPMVNDFMADHPQLRVEIELTNRTIDIVHEGFDLAIRLGRLTDSSLVASRLAPRVMYLCAAPTYLARHGAPRKLSDLAQHNCLIGTSDTWLFRQGDGETMFKANGNWRCNSGQAVLDAALRGFGICQLPDYYVLDPLRRGELVALLPEQQPPNAGVWAVYPQRRYALPKVRLLIDAMKRGLAARPEYATPP
ncbi:LysR family transcriptional regulator [Chitinimonas naiadis]